MSNIRARVARLERLRDARARPLEFWDATDTPTGLYVCHEHPGLELTEVELDAHAEANGADLVLIVYRDARPALGPW